MTNKFYTYAYLRESGTPYYIGRGCGRRAYGHHGRVPVPPRERILFLKKGLSFEESCRHEVYMISVFGRKCDGSGDLWNLSEGGEGSSFYRRNHTDTSRSKIGSALRKAWNEGRHHDMTGDNNPNAQGLSGERNGKAKLTDDDRRAIARDYIPGKKDGTNGNGKELSLRYGVGPGQIRRIAVNPKWTS